VDGEDTDGVATSRSNDEIDTGAEVGIADLDGGEIGLLNRPGFAGGLNS